MPSSETIKQKLEQARANRDTAQGVVDELKAQLAQAESLEAGNERLRDAKRAVLARMDKGQSVVAAGNRCWWIDADHKLVNIATADEMNAVFALKRDKIVCREDRVAS